MKTITLFFVLFFIIQICYSQSENLSFVLNIDTNGKGEFLNCKDGMKRHIFKEFQLSDDEKMYAVEIYEDSISMLLVCENDNWKRINQLLDETSLFSDTTCQIFVPNIEITDFNQDGFLDIVAILNTNINGNQWGKIFLYNNENQILILLKSAEDSGIWAEPIYNKQTKNIHCEQYSSAFSGRNYISTYRLEKYIAYPLEKEEHNMGYEKPIHRYYIGKKGKWKLKKEIID